jgi:hypothetical protein
MRREDPLNSPFCGQEPSVISGLTYAFVLEEEKQCYNDFPIVRFIHVTTKRHRGSVLLNRRLTTEAMSTVIDT